MEHNQTNPSLYTKWVTSQFNKIKALITSFSITEKVIFACITTIFIISGLTLIYQINKSFLVEVPDYGGSITEGIVGLPRFINPILAISDADRDLTSLVYSGLMKATPDGKLIPDLAKEYTVSEDGLSYTFTIKEDAVFHDGTPVTSDDVEFTIQKAQDTLLKSPRRSNWDSVKVRKGDDHTITFILKQPYSPFIQNTTIGILPKHIWKNVDNESFPFSTFNTKPIGSGPYRISSVSTNDSGLPTQYTLESFKKYTLGRPYISTLTFKFYANENSLLDAFENTDIESMNGVSPQNMSLITQSKSNTLTSPLPRVFGVFFNPNENTVFLNKEVRIALDQALDKHQMIQDVLFGYGQAIDGPLYTHTAEKETLTSDEYIKRARATLEKAGWTLNESGIYQKKINKDTETLAFSISTSDAPELKALAQHIQTRWQQVGARVDVKIFEVGDLNQNIIRPRKYDSLLFGTVLGRDLDLYPFWHSSQRNDPGLNIALYANSKTDKILEDYRKTNSEDTKKKQLAEFEEEIKNDTPAVFLYTPYFLYVTPTKVKNIQLGQLTISGERFLNINEWYINTNNIWKFFIK